MTSLAISIFVFLPIFCHILPDASKTRTTFEPASSAAERGDTNKNESKERRRKKFLNLKNEKMLEVLMTFPPVE